MSSNFTPIRLQLQVQNLGTFKKVALTETNDSMRHAANLLATCHSRMAILPAILDVVPTDGIPIPGLSYLTAYAQLSAWWKGYKRTGATPSTWFSDKIQASDIVVTPTGFAIEDKPVDVVAGVPELPVPMVVPRIAADCLLMYTTKSVGSTTVTDNVNEEIAKNSRFPNVLLRAERIAIDEGLDMGDTMIARDAMATKMKSSNTGLALCSHIINKVYTNPLLKDMAKPSASVTEFFNKHCAELGYRKITTGELMVFSQTAVRQTFPSNPDSIWKLWKNSTGLRGGYNGRGKLSVGYYRGDLPSHIVKNVSIVNDILMVAKGLGLRVVEVDVNPEILKILLHNDMTVISSTYGAGLCTTVSKRGIYSASQVSYFRFIMPTLGDVTVGMQATLPPPVVIPTPVHEKKRPKVWIAIRDYIRPEGILYPSSAPADGLCIRMSHEMPQLKSVPYKVLMDRFSTAVVYRNNFIFSRHTYSSQDVYRGYFTNLIYPRLKPETGMLAFDSIEQVKPAMESYEYCSFLEPVPVADVGVVRPSDDLLDMFKDFMDDLHIQLLLSRPIMQMETMADVIPIFSCIPNVQEEFLRILSSITLNDWKRLADTLVRKGHKFEEEAVGMISRAHQMAVDSAQREIDKERKEAEDALAQSSTPPKQDEQEDNIDIFSEGDRKSVV